MSVAHIDGSGPGKRPYATCAAVFTGPLGKLHSPVFVEHLGPISSNEAEYHGLLLALRKTLEHGETHLHVLADNAVMVGQVKIIARTKNPEIRRLWHEAQRMIARLKHFRIEQIPREKNREADFYAEHGAPLQ